ASTKAIEAYDLPEPGIPHISKFRANNGAATARSHWSTPNSAASNTLVRAPSAAIDHLGGFIFDAGWNPTHKSSCPAWSGPAVGHTWSIGNRSAEDSLPRFSHTSTASTPIGRLTRASWPGPSRPICVGNVIFLGSFRPVTPIAHRASRTFSAVNRS